MSRTLTRSLSALALGGLTSLTMIGTANAADPCGTTGYPPCPPAISTDTTVTAPGSSFHLTLHGFKPGSTVTVTVTINGQTVTLGTFVADANGDVSANVALPNSVKAGSYTITASGVDASGAARVLTSAITVAASTGGGLPFTGQEIGIASLLGAGLVGAGSVAVVAGRRRKSTVSV